MPLYRITQVGLTGADPDRQVEVRFDSDAQALAFAVGSVRVQRIESLAVLDDVVFDEHGTDAEEPG